MDKHALHPYLQTVMGNVPPPMEGTAQQVEPEPELAPPSAQGAPPEMGGEVPPDADLAAAMPPEAGTPPPPDAAPGAPVDPAAMPPEAGGVPGAPVPGMPDPNDPLRNSKDEGLFAANELEIIDVLQKLLSSKYALIVMYLHYGATMLNLSRDGIYKHFKIHAEEEQKSAYLIAKKIVAMGGQAAPKVGTVRPALIVAEMFNELLKAEQKIQRLWCELNLSAGQNLGLASLAQAQCEIDMQHADDIRRWMRSEG